MVPFERISVTGDITGPPPATLSNALGSELMAIEVGAGSEPSYTMEIETSHATFGVSNWTRKLIHGVIGGYVRADDALAESETP